MQIRLIDLYPDYETDFREQTISWRKNLVGNLLRIISRLLREIETWKHVVKKDLTRFLIRDKDFVREMQDFVCLNEGVRLNQSLA